MTKEDEERLAELRRERDDLVTLLVREKVKVKESEGRVAALAKELDWMAKEHSCCAGRVVAAIDQAALGGAAVTKVDMPDGSVVIYERGYATYVPPPPPEEKKGGSKE